MEKTPRYIPRLTRSEVRDMAALPLQELMALAEDKVREIHGEEVLLRGLIEFSNHCVQDCLYCGIRRANDNVHRFRLNEEEILNAVDTGFDRGLRTFVLQSGEDPQWTMERLCRLLADLKSRTNNEAAVTLSCGIKPLSQYKELKQAGGDRYLLRFETADPELHSFLRNGSDLKTRLKALEDLRTAGFQLGSGFMVGLPEEKPETLIDNIMLCGELNMDMGGVGPFIPHPETPLKNAPQESLDLSLRATSLLRLMLPHCHIPATTAAGSLDPLGREQTLKAGANVLMPNLTPVEAKKDYLLYPGKICLDESGIQCVGCLSARVLSVDRKITFDRGDALNG